jgi:hypothetical protein
MTADFMTRAEVSALIAAVCLWEVQAMAADGLVTLGSSYAPKQTMKRLETEVKAKGLTVFARIDHAANRASDLWQCQRRHAPDAVGPNDRDRSAAEDPDLAG